MAQLKKKVTLRTKNSESPVEEEPKQKVTLRTKQPEPVVTPPTPEPGPSNVETSSGGGKGKWIAAALAGLLAVGGGGYYLSQQDKDNQNEPKQEIVQNGTVGVDESEVPSMVASGSDGQEEGVERTNDAQNVDESKAEGGNVASSPKEETAATTQNPAEDKVTSPAKATQDKPNAETAKQPSSQTPSSATGSKPGSTTSPTSPSASSTAGKTTTSTSSSTSAATSSSTSTVSKESVSAGAPTGSIEDLALEVIRGKYGNNPDRRRLLGSRYAEIQRRVNEMYRKGLVH